MIVHRQCFFLLLSLSLVLVLVLVRSSSCGMREKASAEPRLSHASL